MVRKRIKVMANIISTYGSAVFVLWPVISTVDKCINVIIIIKFQYAEPFGYSPLCPIVELAHKESHSYCCLPHLFPESVFGHWSATKYGIICCFKSRWVQRKIKAFLTKRWN